MRNDRTMADGVKQLMKNQHGRMEKELRPLRGRLMARYNLGDKAAAREQPFTPLTSF